MAREKGEPIVVLGAGIAGLSAAKSLREAGYSEHLILLGGEQGLPYKRTHLSKNLYRPMVRGEFAMISPDEIKSLEIDYRSPVWAEKINHQKKILYLGPESISYSKLVLALGSAPLVSPGYYFEDDFLRLQKALEGQSRHVRIFGSGVLGAELAEQLARQGHRVTMTCRGVYPMARELPNPIGSQLIQLLEENGIEISFGSSPASPDADALSLSALGVQAQTQLARSSGLEVRGGICVNAYLETSVPDIIAIGEIGRAHV